MDGISYQVCSNVMMVDSEGGAVLFRPSDTMYFGLNEASLVLWKHMEVPRTHADLASELHSCIRIADVRE